MTRFAALAALAATAAYCGAAHATADAHFRLDGIRVELIDLSPDDGVAPSWSWPAGLHAGSWVQMMGLYDTQLSGPFLGPLDWTAGGMNGAASVHMSRSSIDARITAEKNDDLSFNSWNYSGSSGQTPEVEGLQLGPRSAIRLTAIMSASASDDGAGPPFYQEGAAEAWATLYYDGANVAGGSVGVAARTTKDGLSSIVTDAKPIDILLANNSSETGFVQVDVDFGVSAVSHVPEPALADLVLGGLAAFGAIGQGARRRGLRSAAARA